jgi:hypothetical protein
VVRRSSALPSANVSSGGPAGESGRLECSWGSRGGVVAALDVPLTPWPPSGSEEVAMSTTAEAIEVRPFRVDMSDDAELRAAFRSLRDERSTS